MRARASVLVVLSTLLVGVMGCVSTPADRYRAVTRVYTGSLETAVELEAAGVIDRSDLAAIEPYRKPIGLLITQFEDRILAGEEITWLDVNSLDKVLRVYLEEFAKISNPKESSHDTR